jgi:two-component system, chemotaxis family, protein-glutamate methylesterase/glutaminase
MRILHMDDHAGWRDLVREILSDHDVTSAGNAVEGLQLVAHTKPDLVIVDSEMPGMSGTQAIAALVARSYPPRHILMLSASLGADTQARATALGAAFLAKEEASQLPMVVAMLREGMVGQNTPVEPSG